MPPLRVAPPRPRRVAVEFLSCSCDGQRSKMQLVWLTVCGVFFFDSQTGREGHRHLATLATVAPGVSLQVQRGNFDLVGTAGGLTSAFCAR